MTTALAETGAADLGSVVSRRTARLPSTSITQRTGVTPTTPRPPTDTDRPPATSRRATGSSRRASGSRRTGFPRPPATLSLGGHGGAHKAVIAEFILVIVLIGLTPILIRQPDESGHLYVPNDFIRLSAACLLFFVLALASNHPQSARFAAAFGGLVTLGVVFNSWRTLYAIGSLFADAGHGTAQAAQAGDRSL